MKTGYAKIDITPSLGANLNGYYRERYSDHVIAPLYATAVAYSDGIRTALTISLDISEILQCDTDQIRMQIAQSTGLPFEAVFLACIHTHTAPVISEIPGFFKRDPAYYEDFCQKLCLCAQMAIADLKESCFSIARGKAEGISFVRRFLKKDGTAVTNPSLSMMDEIAGPIGEPDETVQLIKIERKNAPDIAIVNFGTHPDVLGETGICPDWPGFMRDAVEAALTDQADGKGVKVIFFNGAQGDVNHIDRMGRRILSGVAHSRHMGLVIAGVVLSIYTYTKPVSCDTVCYQQNMTKVAVAKGTAEQVAKAKALNEIYLAEKEDTIPGFHFNDIVMARKYIRLEEKAPWVDLNVVCIALGDIAFVGLPGEPFTDTGLQIKEKSPFTMTIPCCNANGSEGYFPTDDALSEEGYESSSSLFLPGVAPAMVNTSLETLEALYALLQDQK